MTESWLWLALGLLAGAMPFVVLWLRERQQHAADLARLVAERDATVRSLDDQRRQLVDSQAQLRDAFSALSRSALKENRDEFLHHADTLLKPVRETLDRVQTQLVEVDRNREGSFRAVTAQLGSLTQTQDQLRAAADGLAQSLRSPNVRGRWGEIQLKRIVELAGMLEQCDFFEKETVVSDEAGRQTPDLIVRLPNDLSIVVDAKVPIDAYLAATNAKTDAERQELLAAHARQVRDHIRVLGGKEYWKQFQPSPEFVVMFLPIEPLLVGGVRAGRRAARAGGEPARHSGDADDAARGAALRRFRLATAAGRAQRRGNPAPRPRSLRSAGDDGDAPGRGRHAT